MKYLLVIALAFLTACNDSSNASNGKSDTIESEGATFGNQNPHGRERDTTQAITMDKDKQDTANTKDTVPR